MYLTKSDYKVARTCPTKLYYKKLRYPSLLDDNPYLGFLADGGYMVEKMARLQFPAGFEIEYGEPELAFRATTREIESGDRTLFEATVIHDGCLARIDILQRIGSRLKLVEIKSKSIDLAEVGSNPFRSTKGKILSNWRPVLEDVTYQVYVLQNAMPGFDIRPFLCLVDKSRSANEASTFGNFCLIGGNSELNTSQRPTVEYTGDLGVLELGHVLAFIDVSNEVDELKHEVEIQARIFASSLDGGPKRISSPVGQGCKACEYRMKAEDRRQNGFLECWGTLGENDPHALDLFRIDLAGGLKRDIAAELFAEGKSHLLDIEVDWLRGSSAVRQLIQIDSTRSGQEHIDSALPQLLRSHPYPLHFIDFEASRIAIPYHAGMRPYEIAAFQWSCHTITELGTHLEHSEWLNARDAFPNFEFARSLRDQIGDNGTIYIWSPYELVVLREVREQLDRYLKGDDQLADWLDQLLAPGGNRFVDLCDLAEQYYFHPLMKGSVSIKYVLPAVWSTNNSVREDPLFRRYAKQSEDGELLNPYKTLAPLPIGEKEEVVNEGTGAMRVYQEMMFGISKNDAETRNRYRKLLLQYCELDTAAMVMIWRHWCGGKAEQL